MCDVAGVYYGKSEMQIRRPSANLNTFFLLLLPFQWLSTAAWSCPRSWCTESDANLIGINARLMTLSDDTQDLFLCGKFEFDLLLVNVS